MNRKLSALLVAAALLAPAFVAPVAQAKSAPVKTGIVRGGSTVYILSYESGELMEAGIDTGGHVFISTGSTCIGVLVGGEVIDFNGTPIAAVL